MTISPETRASLTGLQQLQAAMAAEQMAGIGQSLHFRLVEIEEGRAVFEGTPGRYAYNPNGAVHGGYAATLLDSACGCAMHSRMAPGQLFTTLELKVMYHRAMSEDTGLVRAVGTLLSFGRRTGFAEAKLTDSAGKLLASATSTLMVI